MSLFVTRAWIEAWWNEWGRFAQFERLNDSMFYIDRYRIMRIFRVDCLQFSGTSYRSFSCPRAEYLDDAFYGQPKDLIHDRILSLSSYNWSEAVFRDIREQSDFCETLFQLSDQLGYYVRVIHRDTTYWVETTGSFGRYVDGLGSATRLKIYNRRKLLSTVANYSLAEFSDRRDEFFELLNNFHVQRWGRPCYSPSSLRFIKDFLDRITLEGGRLNLSVLVIGGRVESVLFNVILNGKMFNIQSGYNENFHKKISLGTLHLGFVIEGCFNDPEVMIFDMLAGGGKRSSYKIKIANKQEKLVSLMLVRSSMYQLLYQAKDNFSRFVKSFKYTEIVQKN